MWFIMFVGAYLCASASGAAGEVTLAFHKCCQKNHGLMKVIDLEDGERYVCLDRESVEANYSISKSPLIVGDAVPVEYGNPNEPCDLKSERLTLEETDIKLSTTSDNCYDRLLLEIVNETINADVSKIVALSCVRNKTDQVSDTNLALNYIRKCCPKGQSYDTICHLCKKSETAATEESLLKRLNVSSSFIYEVDNGLDCMHTQYAVELSEEFYSFEMNGSILTVAKKNGIGGGRAFRGEWCVEQDYWRPGLVVRACSQDCAAYGAYCVRKCCPVGQHYKTGRCGSYDIMKCVANVDEIPFNLSTYTNPLKYYDIGDIIGIRENLRSCFEGKIVLNHTLKDDAHELDRYGLMHSSLATNDQYCLEAFDNRHCIEGDIYITAVVCFVGAPADTKNFKLSFWLLSISSVCLALTLIVYCSLPELWNLHGRTLICHVSMMLLAFACLARIHHSYEPNKNVCKEIGYGTYFGFMAAFAWLNVMCLDMWWKFGSLRAVRGMRQVDADRHRFLWYSLYAWSITIFLTLIMYLLDEFPVASFLDADIGLEMCWFHSVPNTKTDWPHYIFFVIPIGLYTCTNFVLFLLTARRCAEVKSELHRLQAGRAGDGTRRRFRVNRAKYVIICKLWVLMGAGWVSELASTLTTYPEWLWSILETFNELQGVFIFLILVFKPKVYNLIRKRLGLEKPDTQKQANSSGRTSSTFVSRVKTSFERATTPISQGNNTRVVDTRTAPTCSEEQQIQKNGH